MAVGKHTLNRSLSHFTPGGTLWATLQSRTSSVARTGVPSAQRAC